MDTSEQYIKMCDCPEIQGLWWNVRSEGDFLKTHYGIDIYIDDADLGIWLPRQDQLQEMIYGDAGVMCCVPMAHDLSKFGKSLGRKIVEKYQFHSMEQLWLAFVMKAKNKVWDGSGWIMKKS